MDNNPYVNFYFVIGWDLNYSKLYNNNGPRYEP